MLTLLAAAGLASVACQALAQDDNSVLPDGTEFRSWEVAPVYTRTYHVAQQDPRASDDNPGTQEAPWKTIGRAAEVLQPGERVIVHSGVYREWVKPARGGDGPDRMITYQAAPGEEVAITGSDLWPPQWEHTRNYSLPGGVITWCARLTGRMFEGANPFCLQNFTIQPDRSWSLEPEFELRRGYP